MAEWTPAVERLVFATFLRGKRTVAIASPQAESGVTSLCTELAQICALTGLKTLVVDLTGRVEVSVPASYWQPGQGNAGQSITRDAGGFDRLVARFTGENRFVFGNAERLRQSFAQDLAGYEAVVVDAAPIPTNDIERANGAAAAAACDATLLVGMSGRLSRSEMIDCQEALVNAQVNVLGVVLNEMQNPTLGAELAREARRLKRVIPRFSTWLERKALANAFLN